MMTKTQLWGVCVCVCVCVCEQQTYLKHWAEQC